MTATKGNAHGLVFGGSLTTQTATRLFTVPEAMKVLKLSRSSIYREIRARRLRTVHCGRACRISDVAIIEFIQLLEQEAEATG